MKLRCKEARNDSHGKIFFTTALDLVALTVASFCFTVAERRGFVRAPRSARPPLQRIPPGDFVVKLRGGMERGESGMQCELMANGLAAYFGLAVPEVAAVTVEAEFAELVAQSQPKQADRVRASIGLNFATRQLNDVTIWPVDRQIPEAMRQPAVNVFAFEL
jgi:hypothetical protein